MHELSLLENVREILEQHAVSQQFSKVCQVTLAVGQLSCVEAEALRFGFDVVMQGSLAEGAELIITELPGVGFCNQCQQQTGLPTLYAPCQHCASPLVTVLSGAEMKIKDLLVN